MFFRVRNTPAVFVAKKREPHHWHHANGTVLCFLLRHLHGRCLWGLKPFKLKSVIDFIVHDLGHIFFRYCTGTSFVSQTLFAEMKNLYPSSVIFRQSTW